MSETIFTEKFLANIAEKVERKVQEFQIPGLAFTIVTAKETLAMEGFGFTDLSKEQAIDENTLFSLQSTTKTLTAVTCLLAAQKNLLSIDDYVVKHYPELEVNSRFKQDDYKEIKIRHLLTHTSGLAMESRVGGVLSAKLGTWQEHIDNLNGSWLKFPVGTSFSYSNIGMDLVAYIIERITNKKYSDFIQEVLGNLLDIKFNWNIDEILAQKNSAKGHLTGRKAHKMDGLAFGCGGAFVSIKDQATFLKFLLNKGVYKNKRILDEEYFEQLYTVKGQSGYGFGTEVHKRFGTTTYNHAGVGFGYGSEMYWLPEHNIGLAILYNDEEKFGNVRGLALEILKELLEAQGHSVENEIFPAKDKPIISLKKEQLTILEGRYNNFETNFSIKLIDDKLFLMFGSKEIELQAHDNLIFSTNDGKGIIFQLDEKNKPIGCSLYHPDLGILSSVFTGTLIKESRAKDEWEKYVGIYYYNYYTSEYWLKTITRDEKGNLLVDGAQLYPHKKLSNVFFLEHGAAVEFQDNGFLLDNQLHTLIANPVEFYKDKLENDPKSHALLGFIVNQVRTLLKNLGRTEEEKELAKLFAK